MTLNHGHEVRHKLRSGRTGKVHSVKMRSPKKSIPDGKIELLIQGTHFPTPQEIIQSEPIEQTKPEIRKRRRPIAILEENPTYGIVEPEIVTSVDNGTEAYGYVLRAIEYLSINSDVANAKESNFLAALLRAIEQYEKK